MPRRRKASTKNLKEKSNISNRPEQEKIIVVMFVDIVGCSEVSNNMSLQSYYAFLKEFRKMFIKVCEYHCRKEYIENGMNDEILKDFSRWDVQGDEGCLLLVPQNFSYTKPYNPVARAIHTAIRIALDIKRMWLFSTVNQKRINDTQLPIGLGIGIHTGLGWVNEIDDDPEGFKFQPEGYVINLTKRIEGESRNGKYTCILLSEAAKGALHKLTDEPSYLFDQPSAFNPRGISQRMDVFEVA